MVKYSLLIFLFLTQFNSNVFSQWVLQTSRTGNDLYSVSFINPNTGWAAGDIGTLIKSTNGGNDWNSQASGTTDLLFAVEFVNSSTGWAAGDRGFITKTINGGDNWEMQTSGTANILRSLHFLNAQTGWAAGDSGTVLKTSNGGMNWNFQQGVIADNLNSINFINENTGWISCSKAIYKTTNSGENWTLTYNSTRDLLSIFFINENTGWVTGNVYTVMKSTDGGFNWISQTSNDNGNSSSPPAIYTSVYFMNENTGWYTSSHSFGGAIHKTTSGGDNWVMDFPTTQNRSLYAINFNSSGFGWAVGEAGTVLKGSMPTNISGNGNNTADKFSLSQNFPNPFNPSTNIKYQITNNLPRLVTLKIFDMLGKEVATLVNEKQFPGTYELSWNGSNNPSGVYFYRLTVDNLQIANKKMILLK